MTIGSSLSRLSIVAAALAAFALLHAGPVAAQEANPPATTILDACVDDSGNWRYFGVTAVLPQNPQASVAVDFWLQNQTSRAGSAKTVKLGKGSDPLRSGDVQLVPFDVEATPLTLGTVSGQAKVKVGGTLAAVTQSSEMITPMCGCKPTGCVRTRGYWGNKPNVQWPGGWYRAMNFYGSGMSHQQILDAPAKGNGYLILAAQFITAVLNRNAGASAPQGVQDVMAATRAWLISGTNLDTCTAPGACGQQKTWAAVLDVYNNGDYPNAPPHCSD